MKMLLRLAALIDGFNDMFGALAKWAVALACAISAGSALFRYLFNQDSNALLDVQLFLFAACVMLGAAQVLRVNEHVRVDVLYGLYPTRMKVFVDLAGLIIFLVPVMGMLAWLSWPVLERMYLTKEMSSNVGGLLRWPMMLTIPLGATLLILQAVSEVIKRVGWLTHEFEMDLHYERPLQ